MNYSFKKGMIAPSVELYYAVPSHLNALIHQGKLDLSFVSLKEFLDHKRTKYEQIPGYGIAAEKKILSVNLYHKGALKELDGARVGLTHHSATSAALLKVLCYHFWNISPCFEILDRSLPFATYQGILLIGDEALLNLEIPNFTTVDLAESWYNQTHLPFVFSVIARQKELLSEKEQAVAHFLCQLEMSLAYSEKHIEEIACLAKKQCALPLELIKTYYKICHYRLGEIHYKAISLFNQLIHEISSYNTQDHPIPV
ncbi:MAG: menaquinone biosynthesis protein [Chlamydiia bacterium]|nr:menaquinone biosynthesis protein [Chlamydiia bacterium]